MMIWSKALLRWFLAAAFAASCCLDLPARAQGPDPHIPAANGTTLAGTAVALPDALKGKVGVLVVGFSKSSRTQVAAWGRRLTRDYGQSATVAYYQIPVLAGAPRLLRGMIVRQMGSSVPELERPHFLPLMENEAGWKAAAHYVKPDDAYVLIIDGAGGVRWQTEGDATDAAYSSLKHSVEVLSAQNGAR